MNTILLNLPLRNKRDLVLARQSARQLAAMLEFSRPEQMWLSAAVFEMAQACCRGRCRGGLRFHVKSGTLHIFPLSPIRLAGRITVLRRNRHSTLRLRMRLPHETSVGRLADVAWAMEQLVEHTPANIFEELQVQNQELLRICQELRGCQEELADIKQQLSKHAAA